MPMYRGEFEQLPSAADRKHGKFRGVLGRAVGIGLLAVPVGLYGMSHEGADTKIGPHNATVSLNFDSNTTIDLGPIGSVILPEHLPLHLGGNIRIKEIPSSAGVEQGNQYESDYITKYAALANNLDGDIERARNALIREGIIWYLGGTAVLASLAMLIGPRRREEITNVVTTHLASKKLKAAAGFATLACGTFGGTAIETSGAGAPPVAVDKVFNGTPLEGAQVSGAIANILINQVGSQLIRSIQENDHFYSAVVDHFKTAFSSAETLQAESGNTLALFWTDAHCNVGMAKVLGAIAQAYKPKIGIDAGDDSISGSPIEEVCVRYYADQLGLLKHILVSPGNHDSETIANAWRSHNAIVLSGKPVVVDGLKFLGDSDPYHISFISDSIQVRGEDESTFGDRLAKEASRQQILVVHNPEAAEKIFNEGDVSTILAGHLHEEEYRSHVSSDWSLTQEVIGGSVGGAGHDNLTVGPLNSNKASAVLLELNNKGELVRMQSIIFTPDTQVQIGRIIHLKDAAQANRGN